MKFEDLKNEITHIFESGANETRILEMCLKAFNTGSKDINGRDIVLGDIVTHDFKGEDSRFTVVFEDGAFRKQYPNWEVGLERPLIERAGEAQHMRLKVVGLMFYPNADHISLEQSAKAYAVQRQRAANITERKIAVVCRDSMDFQHHVKPIYDAITSRDRSIVVDLSKGFATIENPARNITKYFMVCDSIDLDGREFHSVEKTYQVERFTYLIKLHDAALTRVRK